MRRIVAWLFLALLLLGAVGAWRYFFPGPEQRIRRRLAELQETVSFRSSDGNVALLGMSQRLGALFVQDARVHVDEPGGPNLTLVGRDNILLAAAAARQNLGGLEVEFLDVLVTIAPDGRSAVVEATGSARAETRRERWIQELRFRFVETEEGWLIESVETVRVLTLASRGAPGPAALQRAA